MKASESISRRTLLQTALATLCGAGLWLMDSLTRRSADLPETGETILTVPLPTANQIRFYDQAILVAGAEEISVFSSICPHLGCCIDRTEGGEIACPCHGSRFSLRGELVRGPARRGLQPLPFEIDRTNSVVRIVFRNNELA